jgi:hypothetical protein
LYKEAGAVIKNQDTPPDDLTDRISEIVAEVIRHFHGQGGTRITGYAIVSPGPFTPPVAFRIIGNGDNPRLPYETIETDDAVFLTARVPPETRNHPWVEIMEKGVRIFLDERAATIRVKFPVDVSRSGYSVRNGVLDISLKKLRQR